MKTKKAHGVSQAQIGTSKWPTSALRAAIYFVMDVSSFVCWFFFESDTDKPKKTPLTDAVNFQLQQKLGFLPVRITALPPISSEHTKTCDNWLCRWQEAGTPRRDVQIHQHRRKHGKTSAKFNYTQRWRMLGWTESAQSTLIQKNYHRVFQQPACFKCLVRQNFCWELVKMAKKYYCFNLFARVAEGTSNLGHHTECKSVAAKTPHWFHQRKVFWHGDRSVASLLALSVVGVDPLVLQLRRVRSQRLQAQRQERLRQRQVSQALLGFPTDHEPKPDWVSHSRSHPRQPKTRVWFLQRQILGLAKGPKWNQLCASFRGLDLLEKLLVRLRVQN